MKLFLSLIFTLLLLPALVIADDAALKRIEAELGQLRNELAQVKGMVEEIKSVFDSARASSNPVTALHFDADGSAEDDYFLGNADAPITIMEFFDFGCGFCRQFHATTFPMLKKVYLDTGKVKFIFRDTPLPGHAGAPAAASFASCAAAQGKTEAVIEALFANPEAVAAENFAEIQEELGLSADKMTACLAQAKFVTQGEEPSPEAFADIHESEKVGVEGTPSFAIFKSQSLRTPVSGFFVRGSQDYDTFKGVIDDLLSPANDKTN